MRFGVFDVDLGAAELRKSGVKVKLQEQPLQVLALLLSRPGKVVTREELHRHLWAHDTFVDFEQGLNAAIMRLRQALGDSADNPRFIETLPRHGYRFIAPVEPDPPPSAPQPSWRRGSILVGAGSLVALALALLLALGPPGLRRRLWPFGTPRSPSIAVLPLRNLSGDAGQDYFAEGMTEEIIGRLSAIGELHVPSHTSVRRYANSQQDLREIARELGVNYVLEGSVRRGAGRVRVTAQLIDAEDGFHVWSEVFDRDARDVIAVQEDAAVKIVAALNIRLNPHERLALQRKYTNNPEAYDAYLRGWALLQQADIPEKLAAARGHFERALSLDSDYPLALAGLSQVEFQYCRNIERTDACIERQQRLANRALALAPELPEAHEAVAGAYGARYDYARAAEEYRQAVSLSPNSASAHWGLAWALTYKQPPDAEEAERVARVAIRLSPTLCVPHYQLGRALLLQGRQDEAITAFEQALQINQDYVSPHVGLAQVHLLRGDYDRALVELDKWGRARKTPHVAFIYAEICAAKGQKERALAELASALADGYRDFGAIDASPFMAHLRSESRFRELMRHYRK